MAHRLDVIESHRGWGFLFGVIACGLACLPHDAIALAYSAAPIEAVVVDADTKQPIEGVIVVASWRLEDRSGHFAGVLQTMEVVTDANGVFRIAGWGPLEVQPDPDDVGGYLRRLPPGQPVLHMFKSGYEPASKYDPWETTAYLADPRWVGPPMRESYFTGKTIDLKRFTGTDVRYQVIVRSWSLTVPNGGCAWARAPKMSLAQYREGERLKHLQGRNEIRPETDFREREGDVYCGPIKSFLDELRR